MTLPSRKNRQITALKYLRPTNAIDFVAFIALVICFQCVCNQSAPGQSQEPPKFRQPTSFRYLLGVRNNNNRGYGSAASQNQQIQNHRSPNQRSQSQYATATQRQEQTFQDSSAQNSRSSYNEDWAHPSSNPQSRSQFRGDQRARLQSVQYQQEESVGRPIGSGVRNSPNPLVSYTGTQSNDNRAPRRARSNSSPTNAMQSGRQRTQQVDPINDPFGDLTSSQPKPNNLRSQQIASEYRPKRSNGFVSPAIRNATPRPGQFASRQVTRQESILRRPDNAPREQSQFSRSSQVEPVGSRGLSGRLQEQPSSQFPMNQEPANQEPANQEPVNQEPMSRPMSQEPMNQEPMNDTIPLRQNDPMQDPQQQDPMQSQNNFRQQVFDLDCAEINGVMLQKSIRDIAVNLKPRVDDGKVLPQSCDFEGVPAYARCWAPQTVVWTASAACSKPLYFQHIQLERYGHSRGPIVQPILSAAHFFGNIAIYPYKAGIHPPNECMYALGYYRPGDCAPWLREPWPWSVKGAASQAISAVGYTGVFR